MLTKSSHFTILSNGDWPSPLFLSSATFYIVTGLSSITSTRTPSATFRFLSISGEVFLGIEPHWDLFRFLFRVKPQPTSKNLSVAGGAGIQLRQ
jgi:hypothetical protein